MMNDMLLVYMDVVVENLDALDSKNFHTQHDFKNRVGGHNRGPCSTEDTMLRFFGEEKLEEPLPFQCHMQQQKVDGNAEDHGTELQLIFWYQTLTH